eukprot:13929962-Ditylum_brightwellii.AAC.1
MLRPRPPRSSSAHALDTKEATPKGIPPPSPQTGVAQKGSRREHYTCFGRGRASAGIAHREGKRNM